MHVAVAIVGYRNSGDIIRCLEALSRSTYEDFEVVICENGGPDSYANLTQSLPSALGAGQPIRAIEAPGNVGYAGGVNIAMAAAPDADAWWVLNPDTLPQPSALAALIDRLRSGDCQLVGGILYGSDGHIQTAGGRWRPWLARAEALARGRPISAPLPVAELERQISFVSGASMLVSRDFLRSVGPMREDYFLYGEEVEWCLRGRARGMRIGLTANAHVLHHQGASTGSAASVRRRPRLPIYLDERNKLLVTRDRHPAKLPVAAIAAILLIGMRFLRRGAFRQAGYALAGWWDGLRNKRGPVQAH